MKNNEVKEKEGSQSSRDPNEERPIGPGRSRQRSKEVEGLQVESQSGQDASQIPENHIKIKRIL